MYTDTQLLELIDAAIVALLTGRVQATSIGDRSYTFADLRALRDMRELYAGKVARSSDDGVRLAELGGQ